MTRYLFLLVASAMTCFAFSAIRPVLASEDEDEKTLEQAMQDAQKTAAKHGIKVPDNAAMEKQLKEIDAENAKEATDKKKAAHAAAVTLPLTALPDWIPAIPDFKASGKATRTQEDGQESGKMTGSSSASPDAIANTFHDWATGKKFSFERQDSNINGKKSVDLHMLDLNGGTNSELRLELIPGKSTKVTVNYKAPIVSADRAAQ